MAWVRLPGSAQRYVDSDTGETISRRQFERIAKAETIRARELRYKERMRERIQATDFIRRENPTRLSENKRYWLQRFSEQEAIRRGISDREARDIESRPGSKFNRLWSAAEREGFEGGKFSAWDALTREAGAKGGEENEHERNKYLAVIAWYMRNDAVGRQRWVARGDKGRFDWESMPRNERNRISRIG